MEQSPTPLGGAPKSSQGEPNKPEPKKEGDK
jgi:hypothetical protein